MQHATLTKSWLDIAKIIVFSFDSMKIVRMRIYILRMRVKAEENRIILKFFRNRSEKHDFGLREVHAE